MTNDHDDKRPHFMDELRKAAENVENTWPQWRRDLLDRNVEASMTNGFTVRNPDGSCAVCGAPAEMLPIHQHSDEAIEAWRKRQQFINLADAVGPLPTSALASPEPPDMAPGEAQAEATRRWGNLGFGGTYREAFAKADEANVAAREAREREHAHEMAELLRRMIRDSKEMRTEKDFIDAMNETAGYAETLLAKVDGEEAK